MSEVRKSYGLKFPKLADREREQLRWPLKEVVCQQSPDQGYRDDALAAPLVTMLGRVSPTHWHHNHTHYRHA
jgi:hypothetical protein